MKILTLSTHDSSGGAARSAHNLYGSLKDLGINSEMLVSTKATADYGVRGPETMMGKVRSKLAWHIDALPNRFLSSQNKNLHSSAWFSNIKANEIMKMNPDIIHIHWVQGGFLSINTISKLNKPIVWTFHDMWPFSGAEHYSDGSKRYKDGYNNNNRPDGESGFDLNRWVWRRKMKAWSNIENLTIVTPSKWMAQCASESMLFKDRRIEVVPVGLNHHLYRPRNKNSIREILGMPLDKKLILIGAMNFLNDKRKGGHLLKKAFDALSESGFNENVEVYVLGISAPRDEENFGFKTHYYGANRDDLSLALLYSAVDVFVAPSVEENFAGTVFESLSCGTPVVAFDIGGMPDMITHRQNGYLAEPFNTDDLAAGIQWILDGDSWQLLSKNARSFVERECTLEIQANRYNEIYQSILG